MNKVLSTLAAAVCVMPLIAQEAEGEGAAVVEKKVAPKAAAFTTLPSCIRAEGNAKVCVPGKEWVDVEEGRYYPLGSSYRTGKGGKIVLFFGAESSVSIDADSEFGTLAQPIGERSRTVVLARGTLNLKLADNLPEGAFFVSAPGFKVKNPAGESKYVYEDKGDGDKVTIRCVTGSLGVEGRHFEIPVMRSANEVLIRTSHDFLSTFMYGTSGDYIVRLDQGVSARNDLGEDGKMTQVGVDKKFTEWHLSPATKVIINRAVPNIGERMSVHTMAFDAAGEKKSECYFCEGRAEINSGELVVQEKSEAEKSANDAAETTETTTVSDAEATETTKTEESSGESNN